MRQLFPRLNGSSPRMWGTPLFSTAILQFGRIIPTHVGNTEEKHFGKRESTDHPHACGEHALFSMRCPQFIRIIPTHVGNTIKNESRFVANADHPHACGEHYLVKRQAAKR